MSLTKMVGIYPGIDPYWTAPDICYGATEDLEWHDPDAVSTGKTLLQTQSLTQLGHVA